MVAAVNVTLITVFINGNSGSQTVPVSLVLAVRCVVFGELAGSSLPAQHRPAVTDATDHQLHTVTQHSNRRRGAGCQEGGWGRREGRTIRTTKLNNELRTTSCEFTTCVLVRLTVVEVAEMCV